MRSWPKGAASYTNGHSDEQEYSNGRAGDALLTVEEVAGRLRVKNSWVYGHAGELGALRLGKYLRFDWSRVLARLTDSSAARLLGSQPNDQGQRK